MLGLIREQRDPLQGSRRPSPHTQADARAVSGWPDSEAAWPREAGMYHWKREGLLTGAQSPEICLGKALQRWCHLVTRMIPRNMEKAMPIFSRVGMPELPWQIEEERIKRLRDVDRLEWTNYQSWKACKTTEGLCCMGSTEDKPGTKGIRKRLVRWAPPSLACWARLKAQHKAIS